jgi:hypothetical protein
MDRHPRITSLIALVIVAAAPSFAQVNTGPAASPPRGFMPDVAAVVSEASNQSSQAASMLSQQFVGASAALKARYDLQAQASTSPAQTNAIRQQQRNDYAALETAYMKRMDTVMQQLNNQKSKTIKSVMAQAESTQGSGAPNTPQQATTAPPQQATTALPQPATYNLVQDVAAVFDQLVQSVEVVRARALAQAKAYAS